VTGETREGDGGTCSIGRTIRKGQHQKGKRERIFRKGELRESR